MREAWFLAVTVATACSFGDEPKPEPAMLGDAMDATSATDDSPIGDDVPGDESPGDESPGDESPGDGSTGASAMDSGSESATGGQPAESTSTGLGDSGSSSSTTAGNEAGVSETTASEIVQPYTNCDDASDCPDEYPLCSETGHCSVSCVDRLICPVPSGGAPMVLCGQEDVCYLLCPKGSPCPDDMECVVLTADGSSLNVCEWSE